MKEWVSPIPKKIHDLFQYFHNKINLVSKNFFRSLKLNFGETKTLQKKSFLSHLIILKKQKKDKENPSKMRMDT